MQHITPVGERVKIIAMFSENENQLNTCIPFKMRWRGREYTFTEVGLRHPTVKGQRTCHIFDITDGEADYRLEFDTQRLTWTLIYIADADV